MAALRFLIEKRLVDALGNPTLGRVGLMHTQSGTIQTPAFIPVGTKATVKTLTVPQLQEIKAQAVLANTYHLYLQPGESLIEKAGSLGPFMGWSGPTFTDSGGFQVMSLGGSFGTGLNKFMTRSELEKSGGRKRGNAVSLGQLSKVTEEGAEFRSHLNGSKHFFSPERSMEIQHKIGADIMFAFDECPPADTTKEYQRIAMERTHRWAGRCVGYHTSQTLSKKQALFGIVQGGSFDDLRTESARAIRKLGFEGYGIGGSYMKEDLAGILRITCSELEEEKPRHLLGIGEPEDFFVGIENGADTFDCVSPTRQARNGSIYTKNGRLNLKNAQFKEDFSSLEEGCDCYTCTRHSRAYLAHLFRADEMLAATLATIHNLRFVIRVVEDIRASILNDTYWVFKKEFLLHYTGAKKL
ncbi:MAG: tRNA guanosine(34) transglycosylase Tgt [Candidatus Paceibacterota bacterium]